MEASHEFVYENCEIKIQLPSKKYLPTEPCEGELLTFNVYKDIDGHKVPSKIWVHAVDVTVFGENTVTVPADILKQSPNAYDIVSKNQHIELDRVAKTYATIAEKAFDLWLRILRWKSNDSGIGRPEINGYQSGWSTYLTTKATNRRIWMWSEHNTIVIEVDPVGITPEIWTTVDVALQSDERPPVFIELMFDAIEHLAMGELHRATVDMAVACECYLRMIVTNSLPIGTSGSIREYLDEASIRIVLTKFAPEILNQKELGELKTIVGTLHQLFDLRNKIVHAGQIAGLKSQDCSRYLTATQKLLTLRNSYDR